MTYPAHQLESEALKTAEERGIDLNPWLLHSKELNRLHSAIGEALTWRQYQSWQRNTPADFRRRFADVARVTKSRKVLAIAAEGLKLVERCEAIADTQALSPLAALFVSLGAVVVEASRVAQARLIFPGDACSERWIDAVEYARRKFGQEYVNARYWRIVESGDGTNLIVRCN